MGGVDQRVVSCGRERSGCFVIFDIAIHSAVAVRKFVATPRGKWLPGVRVSADKGLNEGHRALCLVLCTLVRPLNHILKFTERHFWRGFPIIGRTSNIFREITYIHIYLHTYTHTYVRTYIHTYIHAHIHTYYIHTHIHACIHTYIRTHTIHTYIHTYIYTAIRTNLHESVCYKDSRMWNKSYTSISNFFNYRVKGANFALIFLRILRLDGKLLKIMMPA
jgi:hypothetical protein